MGTGRIKLIKTPLLYIGDIEYYRELYYSQKPRLLKPSFSDYLISQN